MLKVLKDLGKDSLIYGASQFLSNVIGFILIPLYTIYLTPKDYGIIGMLAFIGLFYIPIANSGISNAIFRRFNLHVDEKKQKTALTTGFFFVLFNSIFFLILGLLITKSLALFLVDDLEFSFLVKLSLYTSFFGSLGNIFSVILRAKRKVTLIAIVRIIELLITIGITVYLVVYIQIGVDGVLFGGLIGRASSFFLQMILCLDTLSGKFNLKELKSLLSYGLPFLPHRLLTYGSTFLGQYFIKEFLGLEANGLYSIALRFTLPLAFIVGSVQSAWVPIKFQIHREEENRESVFKRIISIYLIILLALFMGLSMLGPELIRLMTPDEFLKSVEIFPFVLLIPMFKSLYFMLGTGFEYTNDTRPAPLISGVGLIALLISTYILIYPFNIYGAILGVVISWAAMALMVRYFATKRFYVPINWKIIGIVFSGVIILVSIAFTIQSEFTNRPLLRWTIEALVISILGFIILFTLIRSDDFKSLDLNRYLIFGSLSKVFHKLRKFTG